MQWRHLISLIIMSAVFFLSAGRVDGNFAVDQPAPALVTEPVLTIRDQARFEQIAAILNHSATGSDLLNLRETYNVMVRFESGRGSSFNQSANRIRLESNLDPLNAALIFVHEMHHARTLHEGRKADRQSESRQDYVNHMLWEESEGMAASILVKLELEDNGVDVAALILPFEHNYRHAYQGAIDQARLSAPAMSAPQLDTIAAAAGIQALFEAHLRGETRTANTSETCLDYYGRAWDDAHPLQAFVADLFS